MGERRKVPEPKPRAAIGRERLVREREPDPPGAQLATIDPQQEKQLAEQGPGDRAWAES